MSSDPVSAHARRGAHWTFDAEAYVALVKALRSDPTDDLIIKAPAFDHATKDPVLDKIVILPRHRIIIIEGLYTLLSLKPWNEAAKLFDIKCFVAVDPIMSVTRLTQRHLLTGVASDLEEAKYRIENNDLPSKPISRNSGHSGS